MATTRRRQTSEAFNRATQVAETMTAQELSTQERTAVKMLTMVTAVPLEQIQVPDHRTRALTTSHVQELKESISVVGLGQPLITDQAYRLIAGSHRLAAIQQLKAENPKLFKQHFPEGLIPLRVYTFDSLAEPERSQQIEIAENEKRRDYTPAEVKALAQKYLAQGYSHGSHRPKGGEKPLIPALQTYFRLSRRTIQRYLSSSNEPYKQSEVEISASGDALTPKARKIRRYIHSLKQIRAFLKHENQKGERSLSHVIEQLELLLQTQQD